MRGKERVWKKWPTELQTQIMSKSNRQSVDQSTHRGKGGPTELFKHT